MDNRVQVLMSTYNGEKYLAEQLDSILNQTNVEVSLLIRDDGSSDGTRNVLENYRENYSCITVLYGENVGYKRSFMELLNLSDPEIEYFAFSDQDDVWFEDKLFQSILRIREKENGSLDNAVVYQGIPCIVNEKLEKQVKQLSNIAPVSCENALILAWVQGCTMTFNKKVREYAVSYRPEENAAHDKWIFLIGFFLGEVIYGEVPIIYYRQHSSNVTGNASKDKRVWSLSFAKKQILKAVKGELYCNYGREIYLAFYQELEEDVKEKLYIWCNYKNNLYFKMKLLLKSSVAKSTLGGTLALKVAILFNIY
ncbi:MAG: glycosyltransferase family 2 protein [Lachnospiraceae bacterium]|nr:glycosyltransferase family 2 protein [Lachnospiraceae bacterium]